MAAEDVALALIAMDDPGVRQRVAGGDFSALGTVELTSEEQALVSGATPVLPDGHPTKVLVAFEPSEVEAHRFTPGEDSNYWPAGTAQAIEYVQCWSWRPADPGPVPGLDLVAGRRFSVRREERWRLKTLHRP